MADNDVAMTEEQPDENYEDEEFEDELFVIPGIVESDKSIVKEEKIESDNSFEAVPSSSSVSDFY